MRRFAVIAAMVLGSLGIAGATPALAGTRAQGAAGGGDPYAGLPSIVPPTGFTPAYERLALFVEATCAQGNTNDVWLLQSYLQARHEFALRRAVVQKAEQAAGLSNIVPPYATFTDYTLTIGYELGYGAIVVPPPSCYQGLGLA